MFLDRGQNAVQPYRHDREPDHRRNGGVASSGSVSSAADKCLPTDGYQQGRLGNWRW